ncbi:MAG: ABC transporter permease, partial [Candidatus Competibacterales bacterium]
MIAGGGAIAKGVIWGLVIFDGVFLALPTLVIVVASFTGENIIRFPPQSWSLRWYQTIAADPVLWEALYRSFAVAVVCTLLSLPAGTLGALGLYKLKAGRHPGHLALQVYLLLPFTVPLIASGLGMMLLFGEWRILGQLWPVGLALCAINLPFMLWAVGAAVNRLDPTLARAASNCGAPPWMVFATVTLPALMPGIITGGLLMFILAFNEFIVSLLLVDARIVTLPVQIYNAIRSITTPDLAAISVVYLLVAGVAVAIIDRLGGL